MNDDPLLPQEPDDEDGVDGCDLDFVEAKPTNDEDLPASYGGTD